MKNLKFKIKGVTNKYGTPSGFWWTGTFGYLQLGMTILSVGLGIRRTSDPSSSNSGTKFNSCISFELDLSRVLILLFTRGYPKDIQN